MGKLEKVFLQVKRSGLSNTILVGVIAHQVNIKTEPDTNSVALNGSMEPCLLSRFLDSHHLTHLLSHTIVGFILPLQQQNEISIVSPPALLYSTAPRSLELYLPFLREMTDSTSQYNMMMMSIVYISGQYALIYSLGVVHSNPSWLVWGRN